MVGRQAAYDNTPTTSLEIIRFFPLDIMHIATAHQGGRKGGLGLQTCRSAGASVAVQVTLGRMVN